MRCYIAAALLVSIVAPMSAQELSPTEVEAAIKAGLSGAKIPSSDCYADKGLLDLNGFYVTMYGPVGRIMAAAAAAKRKYQPYTVEDVSADLRRRALHLLAVPAKPNFTAGRWWVTAAAEHAVIMPKGAPPKAEAVLQPVNVTPDPVSWSNAMGGKWEGQGLIAAFSLDDFNAMPGDELDVAIIAGGEEKRCKIGKKDRAALR